MTDNIDENLDLDIDDFKSKIFKKYGVELHIFFCVDKVETKTLSMSNLWKIFTEHIVEHYPEYVKYADLKSTTRKRTWVTILQCFSVIAFNIGYSKSEIGRFLKKDHATIIHYLKRSEHYMLSNDTCFTDMYSNLKTKYDEHVGSI